MPIERPPITDQTILKFLAAGAVPPVGNRRFRWPLPVGDQPGDWATARRPIIVCHRGLHLTTLAEWRSLVNDEIYVAEPAPKATRHYEWGGVKFAVSKARLLYRVDTWTPRAARLLACDLAEHVLPQHAARYPADPRPAAAIAVARGYARGAYDADDLAAARAMAEDAHDDARQGYYANHQRDRTTADLCAMYAAGAASACTVREVASNGDERCAVPCGQVASDAAVAAGDAHRAVAAERAWQAARFLAVLNGAAL